jgi:hypothetical protein
MPAQWAKRSTRLRRSVPKFHYFAVPEFHQVSDRVHLHIIATSCWSQVEVVLNAVQCGWGYEDDCEAIRSAVGAAIYVAKYLSKQSEYKKFPKGFRRVRTSQGWPPLPPREGFGADIANWRNLGVYETSEMPKLAERIAATCHANVNILS